MRTVDIPQDLRSALRRLREVRSARPESVEAREEFAEWRERMADALDALSAVLLYEEDRVQARNEARFAREEAARVRSEVLTGEGRPEPPHSGTEID
ncbi:hypothetical protein [Streptosporangium saharense]|uniref:hypothetical protein n=1 Tax=Streptosporangium saharense TaxID=1706840 RepID=UPI00332F5D65